MFGKRLDSYQCKNLDIQSRKGLSSLVLTPHFTDDTKVQWEQGSAQVHTAGWTLDCWVYYFFHHANCSHSPLNTSHTHPETARILLPWARAGSASLPFPALSSPGTIAQVYHFLLWASLRASHWLFNHYWILAMSLQAILLSFLQKKAQRSEETCTVPHSSSNQLIWLWVQALGPIPTSLLIPAWSLMLYSLFQNTIKDLSASFAWQEFSGVRKGVVSPS